MLEGGLGMRMDKIGGMNRGYMLLVCKRKFMYVICSSFIGYPFEK